MYTHDLKPKYAMTYNNPNFEFDSVIDFLSAERVLNIATDGTRVSFTEKGSEYYRTSLNKEAMQLLIDELQNLTDQLQ